MESSGEERTDLSAERRLLADRVGARLRSRRKARELSQSRLAALIGVDSTLVCRWESGSRLPSLPMILRLSSALKCKPAELIGAALIALILGG